MEDGAIPLRHGCRAFRLACSSEKGMSAKQIQRLSGLSCKGALFLIRRVRLVALASPPRADFSVDVV